MNAILVARALGIDAAQKGPMLRRELGEAKAGIKAPLLASVAAWRSHTVLIVDDESDIAESFRDCLERGLDSVRVLTAITGLEALQVMEKEHVDLIITDYRMPGMDGFEFLSRAKRIEPNVSRMIISGYPLDVSPAATGRHQVATVLSKPVDPDVLIRAVQDALKDRQ